MDHNPAAIKKEAYYNDTDQLDFILYQSPQRERIWEYLKRASGKSMQDMVTSEETELWRQQVINWFDKEKTYVSSIRYITLDEILNFISIAADLCTDYLTVSL